MLAVCIAASQVAVSAGATSTVMFVLKGVEITFKSAMVLISKVTLVAFGVLVIIGFFILIAALIIRALAT